jgi:NADH-quinone oxidoreductase subunit L
MAVLAAGAVVAGVIQLPVGAVDAIEKFLDPTFADSRLARTVPNGLTTVGLALTAALSIGGIALAWALWVARPGLPGRVRTRARAVYELFVNKWYFDDAYEAGVVRPAAATGRFFQRTFERVVIDGLLVGGTTSVVRAGSVVVRSAQSGFLRYYAALLLVGVAGLALYFLLQST